MAVDLLVRGGEIPLDDHLAARDVAVSGGRIVEVGPPGSIDAGAGTEVVDAHGAWVLPGGIDAHVHADAPFCDALDTVAEAAGRGGVTTVGLYAYPEPFDDPRRAAGRLVHHATGNAVDVAVHWRLHRDTSVQRQAEAALDVGIASFKVFMSYRQRGLMWSDDEIEGAMRVVARAGGRMVVHAECGASIAAAEAETSGTGVEAFLAARPPETESGAVARALAMGARARCPVVIPHLSSAAGLQEYRARREPTSMLETCPQYLVLTEDDFRRFGALVKVGPPLRTRDDAAVLAGAVEAGEVDSIGSDHAPYTAAQKRRSVVEAPFGMPGVQLLVPLVLDRFGPVVTARVCGSGPARLLGLTGRKGVVAPGADADLLLVDPGASTVVRGADQIGGSAWTPFDGRELRHGIVSVWLRGAPVDASMRRGRHLARATQAR